MLTGLRNPTATICWLNSLIQMLFASMNVRNHLLSSEFTNPTTQYMRCLLVKYLANQVGDYHSQFAKYINFDTTKFQCPADAFDAFMQLSDMKSKFELKMSDTTSCDCQSRTIKYDTYSTSMQSEIHETEINTLCEICGSQLKNTYNIVESSSIMVWKSTTKTFEYEMMINNIQYIARSFIIKPVNEPHYLTAVIRGDHLLYVNDGQVLYEFDRNYDVTLVLYEKIEMNLSIDRLASNLDVMAADQSQLINDLNARIAILEAANRDLLTNNAAQAKQIARYKKQATAPAPVHHPLVVPPLTENIRAPIPTNPQITPVKTVVMSDTDVFDRRVD